MCGIVAVSATRNVVDIIIHGLQTLEYRGYDSAGIAIICGDEIAIRKQAGKLSKLKQELLANPVTGNVGIGHTRWATHGEPTSANAHPHDSNNAIAVVHNGIIENYRPLREKLIAAGYEFKSETDTETLVHLVHHYQAQGNSFSAASHRAIGELEGAYAVAITCMSDPDRIIAARKGSPLVVGLGEGENYVASDVQALINETNQFYYLEEGDVVEITQTSCDIYDQDGNAVERELKTVNLSSDALTKDGYAHYMLKEIHEQPTAVANTIADRLYNDKISKYFIDKDTAAILEQVENIHIIACGTSYHAGLVARYWLEAITEIPTQVEIASEYRYRKPVVPKNTLFLTISQSGETADSLAALRYAKGAGYLSTFAVCNVANSSLDRETDVCFLTHAGPEIGVASTKALTTQLSVLALITLKLAELKNVDEKIRKNLAKQLRTLPGIINQSLLLNDQIKVIAKRIVKRDNALFLGRGVHYPIALEGALKLKEISYIHAEGYPAGELKHGPLALVDEKMPVIAVCPNDALLEKLESNIEEVRARGGELYAFVDHKSQHGLKDRVDHLIEMEASGTFTSPIVFNVPLQLLSYHVAVLRGTDVDQPRNLAKSVTVE
ncbi:glutamine--fructose-6-phosphate transaminase (isomerizing) [Marinicella sp. S1101]|uniref:glutamine--fructose-6-phosphate transaminase (isomerizing) n=1 Tax=Marinicella marina TaxID=2996016 RepID=UPI0022609F34|nr:glutamine--fructose-6-phosphate transaminase (isomerizing) [Marinicella marina]MCX7553120.1 glutamine--fructose-6-phosphate transaminase (isomerizing) [Marinicella marina]MDJ1138852.1 glutamine--fructose-6-phosphate transaminase (isomerizing) [Marinicella marina]